MQRFTYTLLLLIATLTYTACVSDSTSDNNQKEKAPASSIAEKPIPKPEQVPPLVGQEKSIPPPAPTPPKVTPQPIPKPAPVPKPIPAPQPVPAPQPTPKPQPTPTPVPIPIPQAKITQPTVPVGGGVMTFENRTFDYGYIEEGKVINHSFKFTNTGTTPINILNAEVSCGCTFPTYSFLPINPGETGKVDARFDSTGKLGKAKSTITLLTDARPAKQELFLIGTVIPPKKEEKEKKEEKKKEEKPKEDDTETAGNKIDTKPDSLNFRPRGPRKLPQGIPPKKQNEEDGNG